MAARKPDPYSFAAGSAVLIAALLPLIELLIKGCVLFVIKFPRTTITLIAIALSYFSLNHIFQVIMNNAIKDYENQWIQSRIDISEQFLGKTVSGRPYFFYYPGSVTSIVTQDGKNIDVAPFGVYSMRISLYREYNLMEPSCPMRFRNPINVIVQGKARTCDGVLIGIVSCDNIRDVGLHSLKSGQGFLVHNDFEENAIPFLYKKAQHDAAKKRKGLWNSFLMSERRNALIREHRAVGKKINRSTEEKSFLDKDYISAPQCESLERWPVSRWLFDKYLEIKAHYTNIDEKSKYYSDERELKYKLVNSRNLQGPY